MYRICRALLMAAALQFFGVFAIAIFATSPWSWVALAIATIATMVKRKAQQLWAFGTSRWATDDDLRKAGMLDAQRGLILGRLDNQARISMYDSLKVLFNRRIAPREACRQYLAFAGQGFRMRRKPSLVRLPQAVHTAAFAPTGCGKGVSLIIPYLMTSSESAVVVDPKGENARLTAEHRRKTFGHRVVVMDPYKVLPEAPSDSFNPLDYIDKNSPYALDECRDLAQALVVRTGEEKELHWLDSAELWITAALAAVVYYGPPENRSLQTVRDMLSNPGKLENLIKLLCQSDACDGMLARLGGQLAQFKDRELGSSLTTANRFLRFADTLSVAENTKRSSFDPAELLQGKMTVYLVLPPEHLRAQAALLRMWIGSLLRAVVRGGLQEKHKVNFVLDESSALGHLESLDDAVDKFRGYGVRLQFYFQSLGQLKRCFPNGQDQTLLSNATQIFFGVNDPATAAYVSERLGEETIVVASGGVSRGGSSQSSQGSQGISDSSGRSSSSNDNWQQQGRKLLKPEEVMALPERTAITFTPGVPPIWTTLIRYYEETRLGQPVRRLDECFIALKTLAASVAIFLNVTLLSAILAVLISAPPDSAPQDQERKSRVERSHVEGNSGIVRPVKAARAKRGR